MVGVFHDTYTNNSFEKSCYGVEGVSCRRVYAAKLDADSPFYFACDSVLCSYDWKPSPKKTEQEKQEEEELDSESTFKVDDGGVDCGQVVPENSTLLGADVPCLVPRGENEKQVNDGDRIAAPLWNQTHTHEFLSTEDAPVLLASEAEFSAIEQAQRRQRVLIGVLLAAGVFGVLSLLAFFVGRRQWRARQERVWQQRRLDEAQRRRKAKIGNANAQRRAAAAKEARERQQKRKARLEAQKHVSESAGDVASTVQGTATIGQLDANSALRDCTNSSESGTTPSGQDETEGCSSMPSSAEPFDDSNIDSSIVTPK